MKKTAVFLLCLFMGSGLFAQQTRPPVNGWHLLDQQQDGYLGISLKQAYQLLQGRKSHTVTVAVIDSGIDTLHEDLKDVLWINAGEIRGNGRDDDGNGYVDDVYGWNFDGAPGGENLARNSHEIERVYHHWKNEFEGKKEKDIPAGKKYLFGQWKRAAALIDRDYETASKDQARIADFLVSLQKASGVISGALSAREFTVGRIRPLTAGNASQAVQASARFWTEVFSRASDTAATNTLVLKEVSDYKNSLDNKIANKLHAPEDWRGELVHDHYLDINDRFYGNNNLKAGSGNHGTGVAGVIGAVRNNGIGIDGIADNVRIMAVRAVPGGDEHDKDVALAIRYAVDNGAQIINMSFGKPVSPYKEFVDDAIQYAAARGVLLVHAAGNDGEDLSKESFYPSPLFINGQRASNLVTVGASGDLSTGGYAAPFSNYSKQWVDIFAPGMNIYTTATNNQYENADGTSLAAPVVAGVAALLKSYFPDLTPGQIIRIITTSGTPVTENVNEPGQENRKVPFAALSSSGRIVNAAAAVRMALALEQKN